MKNKTLKPTKVGCKTKRVPSDVSASTSLPPLVEGQLRCFLRVTVSQVLWTIPKPPMATVIRLRWWGESSNGTHFYPCDGSRVERKGVKTTARFAIRCGPKQFTSYLTDMGTLVLEALRKQDGLPVGRVHIPDIARLSLHNSISGFFTLVSPTFEKLGDLQVSLALEPLAEAYGSGTSAPITDVSADMPVPALGLMSKPVSHSERHVTLPSSHHLSAGSVKESRRDNSADTPRGNDHLYFQEKSSIPKGDEFSEVRPEVWGTSRPSSSLSPHQEGLGRTRAQRSLHRPDESSENSKDVLSVLLDRGSKLRDAMVVSSLKSNLDSEFVLKDIPLPVPKENVGILPALPPMPISGTLLQDALRSDPSPSYPQRGLLVPEFSGQDLALDTENRAIQLLLGSPRLSALPFWDGESSTLEILSEASGVWGDSDFGDPQYDQSLLETLFYNVPNLDSSQSDFADQEKSSFVRKRRRRKGTAGKDTVTGKLRKSACKKFSGLEEDDDDDDDEDEQIGKDETIPSLSVDQITILAQVRTARLVIHTLKVPTEPGLPASLKNSSKGKPPRPLTNRKCTYFVEYHFPVVSTNHNEGPVTMATEMSRVASCKVAEGVVNFHHQSVFPVHFNSAVIKHWWNTDLKFTIFSRKGSEKKPVAIGSAFFPLRSALLLGGQTSTPTALPVQGLENGDKGDKGKPTLGPLKILLELEVDRKGLSRRPLPAHPHSKAATSPNEHSRTQPQGMGLDQSRGPGTSSEKERMKEISSLGTENAVDYPPPHNPAVSRLPSGSQQSSEDGHGLLLHVLLMVLDGKDFSCSLPGLPNVYLNCKLFASDEATRSAVSWGQAHPTFNFIQVAPVALTSKLLERLKNNMMVIEVWQKALSPEQDRLLGLVKLPLHQFYMSFRDPKICQLLLQAQYPVVGVDSYMPVLDISSGSCHGRLRVLLAMGLAEQIVSLQRMRDSDLCSVSHAIRPPHLLDSTAQPGSREKASHTSGMTEHVFEVSVERVKGLMPLQTTVWGEADCYVQYSFPTQAEDAAREMDPRSPESGLSLGTFRTPTTLCLPDPVFSHTESHVLVTPSGVPVQRLLLGSFSSQDANTRGGIQFEVWCRYYYPNVREQLVANCLLPLSKLCAMVTMQREEQMDAQLFSLPLLPKTENLTGHQPPPSGLMDVCVRYMHQPMRTEEIRGVAVAPRVVMLAVQVHRGSGLQAAAQVVAKMDDTFQYYADTGVNSYVTVEISFLPERERRSTRVVAQSFCPEFEHHTEFPCNLVVHKPHGGACSLAELLDGAAAVFTLHHRSSRRGPATRDTVLGIVTVQLADLIRKRTGICGWFGLSLPPDAEKPQAHLSVVGGLEISINFANRADRERVIETAQGLGWEADAEEEEEEDADLSKDEAWKEKAPVLSVTVSVPKMWLPLHCLQLAGCKGLQHSTHCYVRYKLYEGKAVCSSLQHPSLEEEPGGGVMATAMFEGGRPVELRVTPPLRWYLREERLELQVWVAFDKHKRPRPHNTDRLVGSAYVDLSSLVRRWQNKLTITGVYPLFRRSAPNLSGAALRVHIVMVTSGQGSSPPLQPHYGSDSADECRGQGEEDEEEQQHLLPATPCTVRQQEKVTVDSEVPPSEAVVDTENTFAVSIIVERAMHLSLKGCPLAERTGVAPSYCISYSTADASSPVTTPVVQSSNCPVWDHQRETRLSKQILVDPQQTLVFKVWHKGDVERVIGFASVDLSPLLAGFHSVSGWYNITDFSGQCQGQLKVSVSPLESIRDLRHPRQGAKEETSKDSAALFPASPFYRTSAIYSSFPSHISRYPEQRIDTSAEQLEAIISGRSSTGNRHEEHVTNIRMFHQNLKANEGVPHDVVCEDRHPSSSTLFSALRKNLSELDDIQRYFSCKLSTPTFLSQSQQGGQSQLQGRGDSEADPAHLLLKSNQLVEEVNSIITSLHGSHPQTSCSIPRESTSPKDQSLPTAESETTRPFQVLKAPVSLEDRPSPVLESDGNDDALLTVERAYSSGEEDMASVRDEEEEEEYEETLIEPKTLNEITSLTDKASPWTSVFSEPDLSSLESLEMSEDQPAKDRQQDVLRMTNKENASGPNIQQDGLENCTYAESVAGEPSGLMDDKPAGLIPTPPLDRPSGGEKMADRNTENKDEDSEKSALHFSEHHTDVTDGHQPETSDQGPQLPDPSKMPNFFLPADQLEASMRALHLAPVFPSAASGTTEAVQSGICLRRALRPRPNISSMKKEETKRIAKIFASKFSDMK